MDKITHDVRTARWLDIIHQCQTRTDGTTAHQWLANHGVKEKAYYYWLRKFRKEAYAELTNTKNELTVQPTTEVAFAEIPVPEPGQIMSASSDICNRINPVAVIRGNRLTIAITDSIPADILSVLIKEAADAL